MMAAAAGDHRAEVGSCPSRRSPGRCRRSRGAGASRRGGGLRRDPARQHRRDVRRAVDGRMRTPLLAVAHQAPGGLHGGRSARVAQRTLDGHRLPSGGRGVVAADSLVEELRGIGVRRTGSSSLPPGCDVPVAAGPLLDLRRGRAASVLCAAYWGALERILELVEAFAAVPEDAATLWLVGATDAVPSYASRCGAGSRRPTFGPASSCAAPCRWRRSAASIDPRTCSPSARSSTRTAPRGPRRSPPACRSSDGGPATSRGSPHTAGRRWSPSPATSPLWPRRCGRSSRTAPARGARRRRTGRSATLPTWRGSATSSSRLSAGSCGTSAS